MTNYDQLNFLNASDFKTWMYLTVVLCKRVSRELEQREDFANVELLELAF